MSPFVMALRPKTLSAAIIPVFVAHGLCLSQGLPAFWWVTLCCLASALSIQIATNFINDAIDFKKGADTESRLGPQRVTQSGLMSAKTVMSFGFVFLLLAIFFGIPLVLKGGLPIVILGIVSLFLAYGYTGGPFPLAYLGLGDIFVILFFGILAVGGTFFLHTGTYSWTVFGAGLQVGALATVLIAINNLRDRRTDVEVGKRTLAVRFGDRFVQGEVVFLIVSAYALNWIYGDRVFVWWTLGTLPLAAVVIKKVFQGTRKLGVLNQALAMAGGLQLTFGILLTLGLLWP